MSSSQTSNKYNPQGIKVGDRVKCDSVFRHIAIVSELWGRDGLPDAYAKFEGGGELVLTSLTKVTHE